MNFSQTYSATLAMHPHDPRTLATCLAKSAPGGWRNGGPQAEMVRTSDGGRTWQALQPDLPAEQKEFASAMAYDSEHTDHIYAGMRRGQLTRSEDGGNTWRELGIQLSAVNDVKVVQV
jgi:photosystem II stability/assembly factor-like uncharacterized protein